MVESVGGLVVNVGTAEEAVDGLKVDDYNVVVVVAKTADDETVAGNDAEPAAEDEKLA